MSDQCIENCTFTSSVWPKYTKNFTRINVKTNIIQNICLLSDDMEILSVSKHAPMVMLPSAVKLPDCYNVTCIIAICNLHELFLQYQCRLDRTYQCLALVSFVTKSISIISAYSPKYQLLICFGTQHYQQIRLNY